ncbi:phosphatase PAP2 family protein [Sorangium sp. So ce131]|uniref:phosphatase PAP2 family protein n=1 Tax=Sorangium sp. So ce131 TaxID=3133282 RepID=UPI003F5E1849
MASSTRWLRRAPALSLGALLAVAAPQAEAQGQPSAPPQPSAEGPAPAAEPAPAPAPAPRSPAAPPGPRAQAGPSLRWDERYPRVSPLEHAVTAGLGLSAILVDQLPVGDSGRWENGFDEGIRGALRAESRAARATAASVSDALYYGLMLYPVIVDTVAVTGWRSSDVAWQMLMINAQSLAISGVASILVERVAGRERPYVRECAADPEYHPHCVEGPVKQNVSFPSGHTLMATTGAGLICAHHLHLPLYGGGWPDHVACGVALTAAGVQATLRITSDKHYATDVLVSGALGLGAGYALPRLLHYRADHAGGARVVVIPYATGTQAGLTGVGTF